MAKHALKFFERIFRVIRIPVINALILAENEVP